MNGNDTDSACEEDLFDEDEIEEPESIIPQTVLIVADNALANLSPRWRNWITRVISGLTLISGFSFLVSLGPIGLIFLVSEDQISKDRILYKLCKTLFRPT